MARPQCRGKSVLGALGPCLRALPPITFSLPLFHFDDRYWLDGQTGNALLTNFPAA